MIKKILVALDPDSDTAIATRYAIEIAQTHGAAVTGLAIIDTKRIEAETRGGGIGSMHYAEKMRKSLVEESRETAQRLLSDFEGEVKKAEVAFDEYIREGASYERIEEEMKYHDLLVIGKTPHFYYAHPNETTQTLAKVVKSIIGPTLVVGEAHADIKRVLVAYDGSTASARAMRRFIHLVPFGADISIDLFHMYSSDTEAAQSELMLRKAAAYLEAYGYHPLVRSVKGEDAAAEIKAHVGHAGADAIIAGAHSVSKIKKMVFGSTTGSLLDACPVPIFLDS